MPSTKTKTTKNIKEVADEIKSAAMSKAETAVTKGEHIKPKTKLFQTKLLSLKELKNQENEKEVTPVDFDELRDAIEEEYQHIYDAQIAAVREFFDLDIEEQTDNNAPNPCVVSARITAEFLNGWILANGKNRESKAEHCLKLACQFEDVENNGFDSSCTHFVLTREGLVGNGGHSGKALALTFFAPEELDPDAWKMVPAKTTEEANTLETAQSWRDYYGDRLKVNLVIGAPPSAVLKMDDLRLEADDADYIQLIPYLNCLARLYAVSLGELAQWSRGCALRYRGAINTKKGDEEYTTYGNLAKSGRQNASVAPVRVLTFGMGCIENLLLLRKANGVLEGISKAIVAPAWSEGSSKLPLKDILVAMFGMTDDQKKRVISGLCEAGGEMALYLSATMTKPKIASAGWRMPPADWIVQSVINYGMGMEAKEAFDRSANGGTADGSWHRYECRLDGWDRGEKNEHGKTRSQMMIANSKVIAETLNNDAICIAVKRNEDKLLGQASKVSSKAPVEEEEELGEVA